MGIKFVIYSKSKFIDFQIPVLTWRSVALKHTTSLLSSSLLPILLLRVQLKKMKMTSPTVQSRNPTSLYRNLVIVESDLRVMQLHKMFKKTGGSLSDLPLFDLGGIFVLLLLLLHHLFIPESVPRTWMQLPPVLLLSDFIVLAKLRRQQVMYYAKQAQNQRTSGSWLILHRLLLYKLNIKKSELLELSRFLWNTDLLFLEKLQIFSLGVQHLLFSIQHQMYLCYIDITCWRECQTLQLHLSLSYILLNVNSLLF